MKFGGDYQLTGRTSSVWDKLAQDFSLPAQQLRAGAADLVEAVLAAFDLATHDPEVTALGSPIPRGLADTIAWCLEQDCRCALG